MSEWPGDQLSEGLKIVPLRPAAAACVVPSAGSKALHFATYENLKAKKGPQVEPRAPKFQKERNANP